MTRVAELLNLTYHGCKEFEKPELFADVRRWLAEMDRADVQNNADDLVAQLVAIDGPCECNSALCEHWQSEAGIILTAAIFRTAASNDNESIRGRDLAYADGYNNGFRQGKQSLVVWLPVTAAPRDGTELLLANQKQQWLDEWIVDTRDDRGGYWMMCDQWEEPQTPTHFKFLSPLPNDLNAAPLSALQTAYNQGVEDAKQAIREEGFQGSTPQFITAIARKCSPYRYEPRPILSIGDIIERGWIECPKCSARRTVGNEGNVRGIVSGCDQCGDSGCWNLFASKP